jgi:hypothetical protein
VSALSEERESNSTLDGAPQYIPISALHDQKANQVRHLTLQKPEILRLSRYYHHVEIGSLSVAFQRFRIMYY